MRIVIVGDIHDSWEPFCDDHALRCLMPDLVLFTGDIGNEENLPLVRLISALNYPKAVILGNHDCKKSSAFWNGTTGLQRQLIDMDFNVKQQLVFLGRQHVGYSRLDFPELKLSIVGARPFSSGGNRINNPKLIASLYGVTDMQSSAQKITDLAMAAPADHALIFLGHNGPTGLGSDPNDLCGNDFDRSRENDFGDPDFEMALKNCREKRRIPLVVFGHMHHFLPHYPNVPRKACVQKDGIVYVNAAVVPRVIDSGPRNFTVVDLALDGSVLNVTPIWLSMLPPIPHTIYTNNKMV